MTKAIIPSLLGLLVGCGAGVPAVPPCSTTVCATGQVCNPSTGACEAQPSRCTGVTCAGPLACDGATGFCVLPIGDLIDRAGRPLINLAVTNPFDTVMVNGQPEASATTRERYNKDKSFPWSAWASTLAPTLALYDGLDGTCGHALASPTLGASRFASMASLLAADTIIVDTSKQACAGYLNVEKFALAGMSSPDCGGRKLDYDVVDGTFSLLVGSGATDSVAITNTPLPTFPYLP